MRECPQSPCRCSALGELVDMIGDRIGARVASSIVEALGQVQHAPPAVDSSPSAAGKPVTLKAAAKMLGVSVEHLRRQGKRGSIRVVRVGRRVLMPRNEIARLQNGEPSQDSNAVQKTNAIGRDVDEPSPVPSLNGKMPPKLAL